MSEPSEHIIQRESVQWIRQYTPYLVYAIPNGGKRSKVTGGRLKAEGLVTGMPDLHIPALALFIEMKTATGAVEPAQLKIHERLRSEGQRVEVCRSVADVQAVVTGSMANRGVVPTRQPIKKVVKK